MEAAKKRLIKNGTQYDHLFPQATVKNLTIKRNANVTDTVAFIPKVVGSTLDQTKGIAAVLRGKDDYQTCRNIWQFVYDHIAYNKDRDGYEQIRSPSRVWHDRRGGVDCDCYTTFISSILTNLGIRHKLRITKYSKDYFQHIYPIALLSGRQAIIDCVTEQFDFEVPFSEKKDYDMDLQYLNGIDGYDSNPQPKNGMAELGKLFKKRAKNNASGNKSSGSGGKKKKTGFLKKVGQKLKKVNLKKVINAVNKVNPATIALRNGVLASMKINVGNVAKRLRWSYLTSQQASAKGMDMGRWQKLVELRQKLEKIFYGAGGKPENLKKAILKGKGNKDGGVHGIDGLGVVNNFGYHHEHPNHPLNRLNKYTPMRQLLGDEIFYSENSVGSLGELGEPVTMAMIAAASGVIATIAASLKKIGDVFKGKSKDSKDFDEDANKEAEKEIPEGGTAAADKSETADSSDSGSSAPSNSVEKAKRFSDESPGSSDSSSGGGGGDDSGSGSSSSDTTPAKSDGGGEDEGTNGGTDKAAAKTAAGKDEGGGEKEGFWDKNKKWIIPTGIGVVGVGLAVALFAGSGKEHPKPSRAMNGTPARKKKTTTKTKKAKKATPKKGKGKKQAVAVKIV